jgi:hypothetical protein
MGANSNSILKFIKANLKSFWYVAFLIFYILNMVWVCYDLFVWNKTIFEVNIINFIGSAGSIVFLWIGTLIWRKKEIVNKEIITKKNNPNKHFLEIKNPDIDLLTEPIQQTQPSSSLNCKQYIGYLKKERKSDQIPEECLTCENLIKCSM